MLTNKDKGLIVGTSSMYIKKYITNDTKKDVNQIVSAIINGFKDVLKEVKYSLLIYKRNIKNKILCFFNKK